MFDGDRDIVLPIDSNNLEVCLQASAQSGEGVIDRDSFGSAAELSENKGDDQESDRTPSHPTAGQLGRRQQSCDHDQNYKTQQNAADEEKLTERSPLLPTFQHFGPPDPVWGPIDQDLVLPDWSSSSHPARWTDRHGIPTDFSQSAMVPNTHRPTMGSTIGGESGGVAEWSKATVLKTVGLFRVSWVRIPPPPPVPSKQLKTWRGGRVVEGARLLSE